METLEDRRLLAAPEFLPGVVTGDVERSDLTEPSGMIASRTNDGVLWTHNDSGDGPNFYAMSTSGADLGRYTLVGGESYDWEDMASGPGLLAGVEYLYAGNIGDSNGTVYVLRVAEPVVDAAQQTPAPK